MIRQRSNCSNNDNATTDENENKSVTATENKLTKRLKDSIVLLLVRGVQYRMDQENKSCYETTITTTGTTNTKTRFVRIIQINHSNVIKNKYKNKNKSYLISFVQSIRDNFLFHSVFKSTTCTGSILFIIILLQLLLLLPVVAVPVERRSVTSSPSSSLSSLTLSSIIRKTTQTNSILSISSKRQSSSSMSRSLQLLLSIQKPLSLRGGGSNDNDKQSTESSGTAGTSTTAATTTIVSEEDTIEQEQLKLYTIQQQLLLNSRSLQLRQMLINKGIYELHHTSSDTTQANAKKYQIVDWECSLSTKQYPKSCLYTFDAEIGSKVIAPLLISDEADDTDSDNEDNTSTDKEQRKQKNNKNKNYQWITLSSLNRLRRNDITKVEPLWHNQYSILDTWFASNNMYSLYQHIPLFGQIISFLLDETILLMSVCIVLLLAGTILVLPIIEYSIINIILKNKFVWIYWANWSRFIHSALPLQLAIIQMVLKLIQSLIYNFFYYIRTVLIEYECTVLEQHVPITYNEQVELNNQKQFQKEQITDTIINKLNNDNNNNVIDNDDDDDDMDDDTDDVDDDQDDNEDDDEGDDNDDDDE